MFLSFFFKKNENPILTQIIEEKKIKIIREKLEK